MGLLVIAYLFIIYSFLGWAVETLTVSLERKHFVNMGFLDGPFSPIYGFGALAVVFFIYPHRSNLFVFFIEAVILCSIFEYFVSLFFEKYFHVVWWDYSKRFLNLHGRICLKTSLFWGFLSILILTFLHPPILNFARFLTLYLGINGLIAFITYFIIDATDSIKSFSKVQFFFNQPIEISSKFKKRIKRLIRSYPDIKPKN